MARMARVVVPNYPHHIIQRGNGEYLSIQCDRDEQESIRMNSRTGRPLGNLEFIQELELLTGKELVPKKPGRKPLVSK